MENINIEHNKLRLGFMDVIRLVLCPKRAKGMQKKQMTQALKNVHKRLDMSYIINKLIEFDKLKLMLLTPEQ